jgi:CRP/FNR family transcriptional regulator, cyclic AMP receptor protein
VYRPENAAQRNRESVLPGSLGTTYRSESAIGEADSLPSSNFLSYISGQRARLNYGKDETIFSQGDQAGSVFYIHKGNVKLTVTSKGGKVGVIAILGANDFLGEVCLAGSACRIATAVAMTECTVIEIEKRAMIKAIREQPVLSQHFVAYVLSSTARVQEQLVDHLFHATEKRLARALLLLVQVGHQERGKHVTSWITQETLAEMIGTTRETVNHLLNKFKRLGLVDYDAGLKVHCSLLSSILKE